jgi:hypothetical protein
LGQAGVFNWRLNPVLGHKSVELTPFFIPFRPYT